MADAEVLRRLEHDASGLPDDEIEYIVIWHATGQNDSPPAGGTCRPGAQSTPNTSSVGRRVTGGATGSCTVYHRPAAPGGAFDRSEEHTSALQSLMRISYAVFCLNKQKQNELQS